MAPTPDPVHVRCPRCGTTLAPPPGAAVFRCPCGTALRAPVQRSASASAIHQAHQHAANRVTASGGMNQSLDGPGVSKDADLLPEEVVAAQLHQRGDEQWLRNTGSDGKLHWVRLLSDDAEKKLFELERKAAKNIVDKIDGLNAKELQAKLERMGIDTSDCIEKDELKEKLSKCNEILMGFPIDTLRKHLDELSVDYSNCIEKQDIVNRLVAVAWFGEGHFSDGFVRDFRAGSKLGWVPAQKYSLDVNFRRWGISSYEIEQYSSKSFNEKMQWFRKQCKRHRVKWEDGRIHIKIRRHQLLQDSFNNINKLKPGDLHRYLRFEFIGEEGVDAGGVAREWFSLVTDMCFNVDFGLFEYSGVDNISYQINPSSGIANELHLEYFFFLGRVLGKALFDQHNVSAHFTQTIYKHIIGWPITVEDIEYVDAQVYRSLKDIEETDDVEMLYLNFTTAIEVFGETQTIELVPDGENVDVTDDNKQEYIHLLLKHLTLDRTNDQLSYLLRGFYEVIPPVFLSVFDYRELELLICGLPNINVNDWRDHTHYRGAYASKGARHKVIQWFWETLESASQEQRARFLQFCTGTSRVPVQGFAALQGNDGNIKPFTIESIKLTESVFPKAHTCFNRIELPLYKSREQLIKYITTTIQMDVTGFGIE